LDVLYSSKGSSLTELAEELDVAKSTVHNHLATLERAGLIVQRENQYYLSYRFLTFGGAQRDSNPLYAVARSHINELATEIGDIAALTMEEGGQNVYLYVATGPESVQTDIHLGTRRLLHYLASGKAILAALPENRVHEIIDDHGLPARTPNTITDRDEFLEQLERIRERGYAFDNEERIEGMRAVGASIRHEDRDEVLGAIVVAGSINRMQGDYYLEEVPEIVTRRAREIEITVTYS
jgi:DNA-binding IclR family transcriptional regulator